MAVSCTFRLALKRLWECSDQRARMEELTEMNFCPSEICKCKSDEWGYALPLEPCRGLYGLRDLYIAGSSTPGGSTTCSVFL